MDCKQQPKTKIPVNEYLDQNKIPESWFMPMSELNSDYCKQYMEPEGRLKTLKVMLESMIKDQQKQRAKK